MEYAKIDKKEFNRTLLALSFPIVIQSLMLSLVAAADALMLNRVAQNEMTAVSLATQIQFVQNMFLGAVIEAGSILGAQYRGKGDERAQRLIFGLMLLFTGAVCAIFFSCCELIPSALMKIFTPDPELIATGADYLKIAGWSYLITGISQSYLTAMKFTGHVSAGALVSSSAVISNVALNAVFIFGLGPLPAMNAEGAALATVCARVIELGLCLGISGGKTFLSPTFGKPSETRLLSRDFIHQMLPLMGGLLSWGIGFTTYTAVIGHMGTDAAAANSVSAVVRDIVCCACNGIGAAAAIMVGNELGAGRTERGRAYGKRLTDLSFILGFGSMATVLAVTPAVTGLVRLTGEARSYLTGMMLIMSVYMVGRCVNTVVINGVLDGGGDTLFDMYSLIVSMWLIAVPLAFLGAFRFGWPVLAVYACTCLDEVGKIPWVIIRFRKFKWVKNLTR